MISLIFALSASSALALQYKPWEEHNTNTFTFQAELHPPAPSPWYTATLNYTDQDDLQLLSRDFAAAHGGDGDGTAENELGSAVENELSRSTGWHSVYDLLGLQDHPGEKLLLLPIIESGLGRRLLYVASAAQLAEALGRRLVVLWAPGEHCKASYFDLFAKAPPGVTVVSVPSAGALVHLRPSLGVSRDAHLPPAEAAPVVFAPELFGAHQNATGNRLPAVPIVRVAGSALGPRALTAGRALKASLVSLDHDSGAQCGVFGTPIGEWRARCHDLLSSLRPSRKVGRLAESLVRRTTKAMKTSAAAAAATGKDGTSSSSTTPTRVAPPPSLLLSGVVGIHARRDQPGVDAPILLLPPTLGGGGDGEWTLAGWSEVPLARYVDVALAVANRKQADRGQSQGSEAAVFAVFSNDEAFAQQLAEEINRHAARSSLNNSPPAVVVVLSGSDSGNVNTSAANDTKTTSAGPTKGATARAAQFTSRDVEGSVAAAAEWFALSRCGLVVGAQRSEFMRTASLRSQAMASVEVVPRTGVLVAGGALDLAASSGHRVPLVPCSLVDYGAAARVGREWGVEEALCTKNMPHATIQHEEQNEVDDDKEEEGGEGEGIAGGRVLRRLHIGRTTGADLSAPPHGGERDDRVGAEEKEAAAAAAATAAVDRLVRASLVLAGVGEWTVVDVVGGPGVDLVVEGMHSLRLHSTASASTDAASTSFSPPPPPPPPPPWMLAPHSFSHVYASHVLEHGGWQQGAQALREWRRVLKRGGALSLAVPDTAALAGLLLAATSPRHVPRARGHGEEDSNETYGGEHDDDEERDAVAATVLTVLYGAQRDLTDYHRAGYTETILRRELEAAGFCGVVRVKGFHRFSGDSTTLEVLGTPISLNLEAVACGDLSQ